MVLTQTLHTSKMYVATTSEIGNIALSSEIKKHCRFLACIDTRYSSSHGWSLFIHLSPDSSRTVHQTLYNMQETHGKHELTG